MPALGQDGQRVVEGHSLLHVIVISHIAHRYVIACWLSAMVKQCRPLYDFEDIASAVVRIQNHHIVIAYANASGALIQTIALARRLHNIRLIMIRFLTPFAHCDPLWHSPN